MYFFSIFLFSSIFGVLYFVKERFTLPHVSFKYPLQFRFFNFGAFGLELNLFFKVIKGNLEQHSRRRNAWETFWERFENIYILNVFFRKFCFSYILDLVKTVWALRILSQKFTRKFVIKELWALENHVLVNMLLCFSDFTEVH